MSGTLEKVQKIIDAKTISPTIVNPNSNFVVTTYWWGKGNKNLNTARPCVAFYEIFLQNRMEVLSNSSLEYLFLDGFYYTIAM